MEKHIEAFLEFLRNRAVSEHTLLNYELDIREFQAFVESHDATLQLIDHLFIRDFLNHLYERKLQKSSVARKLAAGRLLPHGAMPCVVPRLPSSTLGIA